MTSASGFAPVPIPQLTDGVVTLRGFRPDDTEAIVAYSCGAGMGRWTSIPQPYTRAHAEQWQAQSAQGWRTGTLHQFAVDVGGRMVGDVNLRPQGAGLAEVGFALDAGHRGRGLMTRALRLALPWGFQEARIDVVHWRARVGNWPSRRVAWAVGFRIDRAVPGLIEHRGVRFDGWLGALRRGEELRPANRWLVPERITGSAVVLREHRDDDVPRIVEACRDPRTVHWLSGIPEDYTDQFAREHLEQVRGDQAAGRAVFWAVADPKGDRLLAELALFRRDPRDRYVEVGYWTHPDARGQGLTTEAVQLAVRHALLPEDDGGLGMRRVLLRAAVGNRASQRVAEKCGFTLTGRDREGGELRDGTRMDDLRFDLLAAELPPAR